MVEEGRLLHWHNDDAMVKRLSLGSKIRESTPLPLERSWLLTEADGVE